MPIRIDLDQFDTPQAPSAASRAYLTHRDDLEQKIQAAADTYAHAAQKLTKQRIRDELRSSSPAATKQSLVDAYVAARLSDHPATQELEKLRWHARCDKFFAAAVNRMLDSSPAAAGTC